MPNCFCLDAETIGSPAVHRDARHVAVKPQHGKDVPAMPRPAAARDRAPGQHGPLLADTMSLSERLLLAAVDAFAQHGYHGTRTREVTTRAQVSSAALYVHYVDKADLLFKINLRGHQDVRSAVESAVAAMSNPIDRFVAMVSTFVSWHARNSKMARVIQYELPALEPQHYELIAEIRRGIEHDFQEAVAAASEHFGTVATVDPFVTARVLLSMGIDIARWYRPGHDMEPDELGSRYAAIALTIVMSECDEAIFAQASTRPTTAGP